MNMFGGTITPFVVERGEYGMPALRMPTADELVRMEAEHAERQRQRAEWEAGRPERERLEAEQRAKQERAQRAHIAECDKTFPVAGMSGEFTHYTAPKLDVWPTGKDSSPRVPFVMGKCDFCGTETHVLEVDNSWGEYNSLSACQDCTNKMFDAFKAHEVDE